MELKTLAYATIGAIVIWLVYTQVIKPKIEAKAIPTTEGQETI